MFSFARESPSGNHDLQAIIDQMNDLDLYHDLVQQVKDYTIYRLDPAGRVKTWNSGAELMIGYTKEEIIGKHFSIFYLKEDIITGKPAKELEIAMSQGRVEDESLRVKKDGTSFWAHVTITRVTRHGKHVGFSKVTRDLTESKAAEKCLIESYKRSERQQTEFLANMAHEIRTPLYGLLGSLKKFSHADPVGDQAELVEDMRRSGLYLNHVIGGTLDCSQLEAGDMSLNITTVNFRTILNAVTSSLKSDKKAGVIFEAICDSDVPEMARGDADRYQQVLQKFLSNALIFTEKGTVSLRISVQSQDIYYYTILTSVTDTGIRIPESETSSLFKRFSQIDTSSPKKYQGTGLGLAISKGIVELMDGTIWYEPNPTTKGSIFHFTAKFCKTAAMTPMSEEENMLENLNLVRSLAPSTRLLLAEDKPVNPKFALKILGLLGFPRIDGVVNGAEAVEKARENRLIYDLILMDIQMPIIDGKQATREIRMARIGTKIVAMMANASKRDIEECLSIGMNGWVSEPVTADLLVKTLLENLGEEGL